MLRLVTCWAALLALILVAGACTKAASDPRTLPPPSTTPAPARLDPTPALNNASVAVRDARASATRLVRRASPAAQAADLTHAQAQAMTERLVAARRPEALFNARQHVALALYTADLDGRYPVPGGKVDERARKAAQRRRRTLAPGELVFYYNKSGDKIRIQVYDDQGRMRPEALRQFSQALFAPGDHPGQGTNPWVAHHPRLLAMLYYTGQHFDAPLEIISAYRVPRGDSGSNHGKGRAVDIRVGKVPRRQLLGYLDSSFERAGIGWYPNSTFVHLDARPRPYRWTDYSKPGKRQRNRQRKATKLPRPGSDPTVKSVHLPLKDLYR